MTENKNFFDAVEELIIEDTSKKSEEAIKHILTDTTLDEQARDALLGYACLGCARRK